MQLRRHEEQHLDRKAAGHIKKKTLWTEIVKPTSIEIYVEIQIILDDWETAPDRKTNWDELTDSDNFMPL